MYIFYYCFFFSSRRRHTRWTGDWSSDVCSSDLTVLRRAEGSKRQSELIRVGTDVSLDVPRMEARFGGGRVDLTKTEFQLLAALAREPGRVFTRAQLLDAVRGVAFESYERAIDAHVKNIRRKIEPDPRSPRYLLTVFGVGYRFAEPPGSK